MATSGAFRSNTEGNSNVAKKVCLLGSAPSSVRLAPFADPEWEIYGCSPGAYPAVSQTRPNAWYELHRWEPPWGYTGEKPWFTKDYIAWMAGLKCPVYMIEPVPEIKTSVAYPKDAMVEKFGPFFFTSTLSYMFAMAITAGATHIHLAGVDMSAESEWQFQRSGCHYFIQRARELGIVVTTPPESDLLRPPPLYGFCEVDPMHIKLLARKAELMSRLNTLNAELQAKTTEFHQLQGAVGNNEYQLNTWIGDPLALKLAYSNPDPFLEEISVPLPKANGHHVEKSDGVQA